MEAAGIEPVSLDRSVGVSRAVVRKKGFAASVAPCYAGSESCFRAQGRTPIWPRLSRERTGSDPVFSGFVDFLLGWVPRACASAT